MKPIVAKPAKTAEELDKVRFIRKEVFVKEQHCPENLEWEFEEESHHFLAKIENVAVGTARWRITDSGIKLERFAVLKRFREKHVGATLLKAVLADVPTDKGPVYLHAQISAEGFYLKHNFEPKGDHFWEADIEHVKMVWKG
jgi:predicted GNAT family N-acyltransferase